MFHYYKKILEYKKIMTSKKALKGHFIKFFIKNLFIFVFLCVIIRTRNSLGGNL